MIKTLLVILVLTLSRQQTYQSEINDILAETKNEIPTYQNKTTTFEENKLSQSKIQLKLRNKFPQIKNNVTQSILFFNHSSNHYDTVVIFNQSEAVQNQTDSGYYFYQNNTLVTLQKGYDQQGNIVYRNLTYDFTLIVQNNSTNLNSQSQQTQIFGTLIYGNGAFNGSYERYDQKSFGYNDGINKKQTEDYVSTRAYVNYANQYFDANYVRSENFDSDESKTNYSATDKYYHAVGNTTTLSNSTNYNVIADKNESWYQASSDEESNQRSRLVTYDYDDINNFQYSGMEEQNSREYYEKQKNTYLINGQQSWNTYDNRVQDNSKLEKNQVAQGQQVLNKSETNTESYTSYSRYKDNKAHEESSLIDYYGDFQYENNYVDQRVNNTNQYDFNVNGKQNYEQIQYDDKEIKKRNGNWDTYLNNTNQNTIQDSNQASDSYSSTFTVQNVSIAQYGDQPLQIHQQKQQQIESNSNSSEQSEKTQFRGSKQQKKKIIDQQELENQQVIKAAIKEVDMKFTPQMENFKLEKANLISFIQNDQIQYKVQLVYTQVGEDYKIDLGSNSRVYQVFIKKNESMP